MIILDLLGLEISINDESSSIANKYINPFEVYIKDDFVCIKLHLQLMI